MLSSLNGKLNAEKRRLTRLTESYPLQFPERLYRPFAEKLALLEDRLTKNTEHTIGNSRRRWEGLTIRMSAHSPERQLKIHKQTLQEFSHRLNRAALSNYHKDRNAFTNVIRTLQALNPLTVMERGFSIVYSEDRVVKSVNDLAVEDEVRITMHDGHADVIIHAIERKQEGEK